MTYYESAEGEMITAARTELEVRRHGCSVEEFYEECGRHELYDAQDVLRWLGY